MRDFYTFFFIVCIAVGIVRIIYIGARFSTQTHRIRYIDKADLRRTGTLVLRDSLLIGMGLSFLLAIGYNLFIGPNPEVIVYVLSCIGSVLLLSMGGFFLQMVSLWKGYGFAIRNGGDRQDDEVISPIDSMD
jgi:hypothetical protein